MESRKVFCRNCGRPMDPDSAFCPSCGQSQGSGQATQPQQPQIVINNVNTNTNTNKNINAYGGYGRQKNKWVAFFLCLFLGFFGAHKFYEGKAGMGILYIFTGGLFGIGWLIDTIVLLCKPNPYYV